MQLFTPAQFGVLKLKNRIILAPLTRARAGDERIPNDTMAQYYAQRADAGLILTEATSISPQGVGYARTPGIWSEAQVSGWKKITEAVHARGGLIVMQFWHVGRISDPMFLNGELPVAPSAIAPAGHVSLVRPEKPYVTPRPLETNELKGIVEDYRRAAENAKRAGFDGVEIHGANGYLLEQFLLDGTNKRTDQYGGSIENRARLALEATDAVIAVWGADRVGYHISPRADSHDMSETDKRKTYSYLVSELAKRKLAFVFAREHQGSDSLGPELKKIFGGAFIANEKFTQTTAEETLKAGHADAVAFGLSFIANPDLVTRFKEGAPLNQVNFTTLYSQGAEGYTDYPTLR
jgi:2,4-dienoyl-CoA reductase-like NADH-dependent reductase (Old Yellow Enzyme family)